LRNDIISTLKVHNVEVQHLKTYNLLTVHLFDMVVYSLLVNL